MKEITCIVCPKGCTLTVDGANGKVTGNSCDRGKDYGLAEVTNPTRVLTTTVAIDNDIESRLPVKTSAPIPKGTLSEAMAVIDKIRITAPVQLGQVIYPNLLNTGIDLVACRSM